MYAHKTRLAAQTRGDLLPVDCLDAELARAGLAMWQALRHGERFPERARMTSCLTRPLRDNSFLIEVLEDGADYRTRDVGATLVRAFNQDFSGHHFSRIIQAAPRFGLGLKMLCEMVRAGGEPLGYRGWVGEDLPGAAFVYHESVILPLGEDGLVDHLLVVSALVLREPDGMIA